ncbi:MAG TPA: cytochrome c maturation protein CcmE [Candidatus Angelobacter sp.]
MTESKSKTLKFGVAIGVIVLTLGYLTWTGVSQNKSFFVTIAELRAMGDDAYARQLRVTGFVRPGSIHRNGTKADFVIEQGDLMLPVSYKGMEPPPDTFKDHAQAVAIGQLGRDGTFQARELQAKCASKYEDMEKAQAGQSSAAGATRKN